MSSYGETPGEIGLKVISRRAEGGFVVLRVGRLSSTMAPLRTNELERLAHALRQSAFVQQGDGTRGFPYTLPATLGE